MAEQDHSEKVIRRFLAVFGIVAGFIMTALGAAQIVNWTVAGCVIVASAITFVAIARVKSIKNLSLLFRLPLLATIAVVISLSSYFSITWMLKEYYRKQITPTPTIIGKPEKPPLTATPETKGPETSAKPIQPSEEKDTSVLDLIKRYPVINEVIKGEKSCHDLAPEAQIVCVKENARLKFAAMVLTQPGLTAEQRTSILQQTTLADMKRLFEVQLSDVMTLKDNFEAHKISMPPEVAMVYVFLQKPETLGDGSSEFLGRISRDEFLRNVSQYESMAKSKRVKLIIRASTADQKQWLQNQIKYDDKILRKSKFRDPSDNKISEGVEWPLGGFQEEAPKQESSKIPNLHELFEKEFSRKAKLGSRGIPMKTGTTETKIFANEYLDFQANSKFLGFYIPESPYAYKICEDLSDKPEIIMKALEETRVSGGYPVDFHQTPAQDLVFSNKIYIYHEDGFSHRQIADLEQLYKSKGLLVIFRGRDSLHSLNQSLKKAFSQLLHIFFVDSRN